MKCITCVNTDMILLLQTANTITSTLMHYCQTATTVEYIQGGQKRLFLRDENFVTFTGKKVCDMYKVSKFCLEKCIPKKTTQSLKTEPRIKKGK